jgi:hypothetical protein
MLGSPTMLVLALSALAGCGRDAPVPPDAGSGGANGGAGGGGSGAGGGGAGPACLADGEACHVDADCCGICDLTSARCDTPAWLSCKEPAHAIVPADAPDTSPGGQLRYLLDHGYQGDIYDGHGHQFAIPETSGMPDLANPEQYRFVTRPLPLAQQVDLYSYYAGEHLGVRGSINLALPNLGGLGDPTSSYEYQGESYLMAYTPAEAGQSADDDNVLAFAGNVMSAAALYTKQRSYEPATSSYHSFAYSGMDWADVRAGIEDGSIADMDGVKSRLEAQAARLRDLGFDGLKFVSEWNAGRNGKWGVARPLVGLESVASESDPWTLDGDLFNGPGGIFDTAAKLGLSVLVHATDGASPTLFWQQGGVWDQILTAHPGLKLTVAHGFAFIDIHGGKSHAQAAAACDALVDDMKLLFSEHDGTADKSMITVDMLVPFIAWWVEHNQLFQQSPGDFVHDYRQLFIEHRRHFVLGMDLINGAVRAFQSDGCGSQDNPVETAYLNARIQLEGPWGGPHLLDLVGAGDTLDRVYRQNVFAAVVAGDAPGHVGPAGVDANGVRRIDCAAAGEYLAELRESVRTVDRGTSAGTDPLVLAQEQIRDAFLAGCAR